jgi:hypothetical protein
VTERLLWTILVAVFLPGGRLRLLPLSVLIYTSSFGRPAPSAGYRGLPECKIDAAISAIDSFRLIFFLILT